MTALCISGKIFKTLYWQPFLSFAKLYKGPLLIANLVKFQVSGLRQVLAA